ncbi:uncharacterized protein LOC135924501 [Gordionus sp. m RMFG-2023]|uniref:uncharacterized protein LOC135924501 n=1 Tax=Gordionus sp. m RMFG-2023 TaxID=3053472 RepID=UPI0031FC6EDC
MEAIFLLIVDNIYATLVANYSGLCSLTDYPDIFNVHVTEERKKFFQLDLHNENNSIISYIQGGDGSPSTDSVNDTVNKKLWIFETNDLLNIIELKNLRRTLKVEANVEFQLNSIGSWIEICLLPLYNRPYNCLEFTNANITINVTNNLVSVQMKQLGNTGSGEYLNYILYSLSWSLPKNNFYQYSFVGGIIKVSCIITICN